MADIVFNVAKGLVNAYHDRVNDNDPATATITIVVIDTSATDDTLRDMDDLAAILADPSTAEVTNTNYNRKDLSDTEITGSVVDDTNNKRSADLPDQAWTAVVAGDGWTDLVICYNPTGGVDSTLIPLVMLDFVRTPDGNDILVLFNTLGYFEAS